MRNNRVNLRITVGVVFLAIVGSFSSALAYPIFFKCDSNHQMSEFLAGQEVLEGISKLKAEFNDEKKVLSALCEGKSECERNLGQILKLTDIARSVAQAKEAQILGQLKNEMNTPIAKVNDETFELEKKIRDLAAQVNACRRTEESLKPEDWKVNSCVLFYFPFKNEYSYVTGFQTSKGSATRLQCPNADGIKSTVRKSLMMGVDPLVYMSLGLMESGSNGWQHGLFLDPIGIVKGMGCPDNDDNPTVPGINKMNSYGNYHTVKPGVIEDAEFSDRLKALAKENQAQVSEGKSYVCADLHNKANLTISQASIANQCCMHLQFQLNGSSSDQTALIKQGLTFEYIHKMLNHALRDKADAADRSADPAFKMQRYNGWSELMGGAHQVEAFRSGINLNLTPTYGYQAMDYILNSLAANPWLLNEIESAKKELKSKSLPPSILCLRSDSLGANYIDSRHYFNEYRKAGRMDSIVNKSWSAMSDREKSVFSDEIAFLSARGTLTSINGKALPPEVARYQLARAPTARLTQIKYIIEGSDQPKQVITESPHETKFQFANFVTGDLTQNGFTYEGVDVKYTIKPIGKSALSLSSAQLEGAATMEDKILDLLQPPFAIEYKGVGKVKVKSGSEEECQTSNGTTVDCTELLSKVGNPHTLVALNSEGEGFSFESEQISHAPITRIDPHVAKVTFANGKWVQVTETKNYVMQKGAVRSIDRSRGVATMDEVSAYYFKHIYEDRNTVGKASEYPGNPMNDKEIAEMVARLSLERKTRTPSSN